MKFIAFSVALHVGSAMYVGEKYFTAADCAGTGTIFMWTKHTSTGCTWMSGEDAYRKVSCVNGTITNEFFTDAACGVARTNDTTRSESQCNGEGHMLVCASQPAGSAYTITHYSDSSCQTAAKNSQNEATTVFWNPQPFYGCVDHSKGGKPWSVKREVRDGKFFETQHASSDCSGAAEIDVTEECGACLKDYEFDEGFTGYHKSNACTVGSASSGAKSLSLPFLSASVAMAILVLR
eukprot:TRINITY_DN32451_c0_g2_i1.p1 TRINITY_DN32451_c0_g2~~TRINITY_DN32451_c0_g2_i1.p1  ORF type:complete len:236 (+),score=33.59 TRINITY_DN32451_c0_g2_i1:64-771(+)